MELPVAEDLLRNIESFTIAIGDVLEADSTENTTESRNVTLRRDNIGKMLVYFFVTAQFFSLTCKKYRYNVIIGIMEIERKETRVPGYLFNILI